LFTPIIYVEGPAVFPPFHGFLAVSFWLVHRLLAPENFLLRKTKKTPRENQKETAKKPWNGGLNKKFSGAKSR
jgi:hypothetical protein